MLRLLRLASTPPSRLQWPLAWIQGHALCCSRWKQDPATCTPDTQWFGSSLFPAQAACQHVLGTDLLHSQLYLFGSHYFSACPAISLGFTFTFFFCVPRYISGLNLPLLRPQLYLWGSPSSSAFPTISLRFTVFFAFQAISLGFTFVFFCASSYISGVHRLLHLRSQLYLWGQLSSSSAFPATSLGFTFLFLCVRSYISGVHFLLLHSQLYLWGLSSSTFPTVPLGFTLFIICIPRYISGVHLLFCVPDGPVKTLTDCPRAAKGR